METTVAVIVLLIVTGCITVWVTRLEHRQKKLEHQLALVSEVLGRATPELGRKIEENSTKFVFNESSWPDEDYSEGKDWSV